MPATPDIYSVPSGGSVHAGIVAAALPAWVSALPLWQWYEIPNTALSSVDPSPTRVGVVGPSSKIDKWCGATLRRAGSVYMLGAAGGHNDYGGNEVNALALNVATPAWVELLASSPNNQIIGGDTGGQQFNLDLSPSSTHTYYATQFADAVDRMIVMPSPGYTGAGEAMPEGWTYVGNARSFVFNYADPAWEHPNYVPSFPAGADGGGTACLCMKHPGTGEIYYGRNSPAGGEAWWKLAANLSGGWTQIGGSGRAPWWGGGAIDPVRDLALFVGGYDPTDPAIYNLSGVQQSVTFGGLGPTALRFTDYPGVVFDEANDCWLVFSSGASGIEMWRVDPVTYVVSKPTVTGTLPPNRSNGIHNSVQYVPELKGVVIATQHNGNVRFMRTAV